MDNFLQPFIHSFVLMFILPPPTELAECSGAVRSRWRTEIVLKKQLMHDYDQTALPPPVTFPTVVGLRVLLLQITVVGIKSERRQRNADKPGLDGREGMEQWDRGQNGGRKV